MPALATTFRQAYQLTALLGGITSDQSSWLSNGMEAQVYTMSIMGIDLDNQTEAQYPHDLVTKLGIDQCSVNQIHEQLAVPTIYG